MRNRHRTAALAILLSTLAATGGAQTPLGALLDSVDRQLLAADPKRANPAEGFRSLLEAIAAVSATDDLPAEFAGKLQEARRGEPGEKTRALMADCYRLAHGGTAFRMPEGVVSMNRAVDYARRRLAAARAMLEAGKSSDGLRALLDVALVAATPMESHGH